MSMSYKLIIKSSQPIPDPEYTTFWVNPLTGQLSVMIGGWTPIISGGIISSYTEGVYIKTLKKQETQPTGEIGLLWYKPSTHKIQVYLDDWLPYLVG